MIAIVKKWLRRAWHLSKVSFAVLAVNASLVIAEATADASIRILALGDSLTAGYGLSRAEAFPAKLQVALNREGGDVEVTNGGFSGDTSAGGVGRLAWLLGTEPTSAYDALIIELGANDGLRGLDPVDTERNLAALIDTAKQRGLVVLLTGMLAPPNLGADYGKQFNGLYKRLADVHGIAFYPFFLEGVAARRELNLADALHPNAAGVDVIVERILPLVRNLLGEVRKRQNLKLR
jgi:acyl-CoA thioesterase-1